MDNALVRLINQAAASKPKPEETDAERSAREAREDAAYSEMLERRVARIAKWAAKQERSVLEEHFSLAVMLLIERGKTARLLAKIKKLENINHKVEIQQW